MKRTRPSLMALMLALGPLCAMAEPADVTVGGDGAKLSGDASDSVLPSEAAPDAIL